MKKLIMRLAVIALALGPVFAGIAYADDLSGSESERDDYIEPEVIIPNPE